MKKVKKTKKVSKKADKTSELFAGLTLDLVTIMENQDTDHALLNKIAFTVEDSRARLNNIETEMAALSFNNPSSDDDCCGAKHAEPKTVTVEVPVLPRNAKDLLTLIKKNKLAQAVLVADALLWAGLLTMLVRAFV